jgi:hypothetical protein
MKQFEILNHATSGPITEETFILQDSKGKLIYKEWLNEKGKVIDFQLRDKDGFSIDDLALVEEIQAFLENIEDCCTNFKY